MVIAILVLIAAALGESMYTRWLLLLMVPLTISALGLVHWMVAQGKIPKAVLWPLYICLLLMDQLTAPMLGFVAMLDSWVGLRKFRSDREV